jgi:hypothetical protein
MPKSVSKRKFITDCDDEKYLLALGYFIARFAQVELILNSAVRYFAKLGHPSNIANALLGPLRVDAAMATITRLIEARKLRGKDIDELKLIIDQLGKIARARNDIMHLGAEGYGRLVVTNRQFAHTRNRIRLMSVSAKVLKQMEGDLLGMYISLSIIIRDTVHGSPRTVRGKVGYISPASWQYKSHVRALRPRKSRAKIRKQPNPPQPSPA